MAQLKTNLPDNFTSRLAVAYIRVSTDDQTEFSPDAQLSAIQEYATRNGYILTEIFKDEGITGTNAEKRPGFMRMIATAKQKPAPFEVILVHKLDRFSRSREDSVVYKSLLRKECGVKVISITENIEDDKFGVLIEALLEAMAEYYSLNLSDEVIKGMTEKAKRGGLQAVPSFGYAAENNKLIIVPEEATIVRDIFQKFVTGGAYFAIARELNQQGIRTHQGNVFENRTIEYIIRNPVYIGNLRWTPTGRTRRNFDNPDTIIAKGAHEPIIDIDTWEAAQKRVLELKNRHPRQRPASEHKHWLSGIFRCAVCGRTLVYSGQNAGWRCNGYAHGQCRTTQSTPIEKLEELFLCGLRQALESTMPLQYVDTHAAPQTSNVEILRKKIVTLDKRLERVKLAYYDGVISVSDFKSDKTRYEHDKQLLLAEIEALQSKPHNDMGATLRKGIKAALVRLDNPQTDVTEKHAIAHEIVSKVIYSRDNGTIAFVFLYS